jgi:3-methyl-2-oxobutanoate hydroxymethyltransferase
MSKVLPETLRQWKREGRRCAMLTAYDYPMARLLDEAGIPVLLVGDSVGMVVHGFPDTTHVTIAMMEHHVAAVARAQPQALIVADLPYQTYRTPAEALSNAQRLRQAGAEAVKLEGGAKFIPQIEGLLAAQIPVMGHLGMLPQSILEEGSYRIKGKIESEREAILIDALALEKAGVFAIVLELVWSELATTVSQRLEVPTIGIGSGSDCDGQVLVTTDIVGYFPWFRPKFVEPRAAIGAAIRQAAWEFREQVEAGDEARQ